MKNVNVCLILISAVVALGHSQCSLANWGLSFDNEGLSSCDNLRLIRGFDRSRRLNNDIINVLEGADCCAPTANWSLSSRQTVYTDWWIALDSTNVWVSCLPGYFLQGLYRSFGYMLSSIEEGRCSKPPGHPNYYGQCYVQDISWCFEDTNLCECNQGYFMTGFYKGGCDKLYCIEKLHCCQMAPGSETLDELSKVKTFVMDTTMSSMATLAHYLGYSYCSGCGAQNIGEDFIRQGDSWVAEKSHRCAGYKSDQRLTVTYENWDFILKDVIFGNHVIDDLVPETVDSGTFYNYDQNEATKTISLSETVVTSVTHTKTSSWKNSVELGIEIDFIVGSSSFKFSYENLQTTEDSTHQEKSRTFDITSSKTLPANSSASWRLVILKTRRTIPYTATVLAKFSTQFKGILRSAGGGKENFHTQYWSTNGNPTFNYRFGDSKTPFYNALNQQSQSNSNIWMWSDMKNKYRDAQSLIDQLSDENGYAFTLTGQFEEVDGKHVDFVWESGKTVAKRSADFDNPATADKVKNHIDEGNEKGNTTFADDNEKAKNPLDGNNDKVKKHKLVAKARPDDVPAPRPAPPVVELKFNKKILPLPRVVPDS